MIVTIDGPAGSGKSSTAKRVAKLTGWHYLDSGSLYRTYALIFMRYGRSRNTLLRKMDLHKVELIVKPSTVLTTLDGEDVGERIRTPDVSAEVSQVSAIPEVRERVNSIMRIAVEKSNFIADGRDLGSVVFPDAKAKFFMIADLDERAKRRFEELQANGVEASLEEIRANLESRDEQDSTREIAPLIKPEGAIEIDTTNLSFDDQVELIVSTIKELRL
jgi:cytidylate kinase